VEPPRVEPPLVQPPRPPALGFKAKVAGRVMRLPGLHDPRVGAAYLRAQRARRRHRRAVLEARGDDRLSWPALHDLDRQLVEILPQRPGFFIEAGANDGYEQSNTYALEKLRGWRGLLVEPIPALYQEAVKERPGAIVRNAALVDHDFAGTTVEMRHGGLMSVVSGARGSVEADHDWVAGAFVLGLEHEYTVEVPARTLDDLIVEAGDPHVDLLSLDVEGYEPQVLAGLDLARRGPDFLLIEVREPATGKAPIDAIVGEHYDEGRMLSPYDVLYTRRTPRA
jgi:FkbM family methyltransferase